MKKSRDDLLLVLNSIKNAGRVYRNQARDFVLKNPETFSYLLDYLFGKDSKISIKAAWTMDLVCIENIYLIEPYLNYYTENLHLIKNDSTLRPMSKICSLIGKEYYSNKKNEISKNLTLTNIEQIIENSFDWLIGDYKTATKVFAMESLFLFGYEFQWVHTELKLILQDKISSESTGFQNRAKKVLVKINQKKQI